jgi:hypothetical protein
VRLFNGLQERFARASFVDEQRHPPDPDIVARLEWAESGLDQGLAGPVQHRVAGDRTADLLMREWVSKDGSA